MAQSPLSPIPTGLAFNETAFSPSYAAICRTGDDGGQWDPPLIQEWTYEAGDRRYPIVDGKYFDGRTGRVEPVDMNGQVTIGPPTLDVFWHNRMLTGREDQFFGAVGISTISMTEYVIRVGEFLKECNCDLQSLTATTYSLNVILFADMSKSDVYMLWERYGL